MPKYLSGRSKVTRQSELKSDRYRYLSIENAEPSLGDPLVGPSSATAKPVPPGQQFIMVSVEGSIPGERYWIPNQGGIIPGSISVFDDNVLVGTLSSITQLNFVGAAITASVSIASSNLATIRVFSPGNNQEIIFNTANEFSTSTKLKFDPLNGLLTAGDRIIVGAGGTVITTTDVGSVGIGTTNPTQELHVQGDLRLTGTIYDSINQPGTSTQILVKNNFGGLIWIDQGTIRAGAGGTYQNIQFQNSAGLVDGAPNFVFDEINNRIGIGSTQPKVLLDVLGISSFKGGTTIDNLNVTGVTTTRNLTVTGVSTVGFVTGTSAFFTGIVTATKFVGEVNVTNLYVTGISTFLQKVNINSDLGVTGITTTQNLQVYQSTTLNRLNATGVSTFTNIDINGGEIDVTRIGTQNLNVSGVGTFTSQININNLNVTGVGTFDNIKIYDNNIETTIGNLILNSQAGITQIDDAVYITDTTESTSKDTGSIITEGGVGIEKNLYVGGNLYVDGDITSDSADKVSTGTTTGTTNYYPTFVDSNNATRSNEFLYTDSLITYNPLTGRLGIGTTNPGVINGILQVSGGIGLAPGSQIRQWTNGDTVNGTLTVFATQLVAGAVNSQSYGYVDNSQLASVGNIDGSLLLDAGRYSPGGKFRISNTSGGNISLSLFNSSTGNYSLYSTSNGNTGIGTSNPTSKLQVAGNVTPSVTSTYDLGTSSLKWNNIYANTFVGTIIGNADTAAKLQTPRNIDIDGDVIGVGIGTTFDGSRNVTIPTVLSTTGVTAGTYGSSTQVGIVTVDSKGRITAASNVNINFSTATVANVDKVATISTETNASFYPTFVDSNNSTAAYEELYTDANISYNPSTNLLTVPNIRPTAIQDTSGGTGTDNYVLTANGSGGWTWKVASVSGGSAAIGGITVQEEGSGVGNQLGITTVNFVGNSVTATSTVNGTSTITFTPKTTDGTSIDAIQSTANSAAQSTGYASTSGISTNIKGGAASQIPYQSAADTTAFIPNGTPGQLLQSNGTSAPSWVTASTALLNPVGNNNQVLYKNNVGIVTTSPNFQFDGTTVFANGDVYSYRNFINSSSSTSPTPSTNVRVGWLAGTDAVGNPNTVDAFLTCIGNLAFNNGNGFSNVAVGVGAGKNCIGNINTFVGVNAGENCNGSANLIMGANAGLNQAGNGNIIIGAGASAANLNGNYQLSIGNGENSTWIYGNSSYFVGLGTTAPTQRLHVQGNIFATGSYSGSDINLKKNIQTIPNGLNKVLQLRGVEFDWKDTNEHQIGVIAQEVEKIIPEVVVGENGSKGVAYQNLVAVLIEAIKELAERVQILENQ